MIEEGEIMQTVRKTVEEISHAFGLLQITPKIAKNYLIHDISKVVKK